jgi:hypothetical protein
MIKPHFNSIMIATILASGKMVRKMVTENYIFQMEVLIVEILKMELHKVKEDYYIQMATSILEIGQMIKPTEKALIFQIMEVNMKGIGYKI